MVGLGRWGRWGGSAGHRQCSIWVPITRIIGWSIRPVPRSPHPCSRFFCKAVSRSEVRRSADVDRGKQVSRGDSIEFQALNRFHFGVSFHRGPPLTHQVRVVVYVLEVRARGRLGGLPILMRTQLFLLFFLRPPTLSVSSCRSALQPAPAPSQSRGARVFLSPQPPPPQLAGGRDRDQQLSPNQSKCLSGIGSDMI